MPGWKRVLTILLIVLGPGIVIYFLASNLTNKFVELPYLGEWTFEYDDQGKAIDSTAYSIPDFTLTNFDGTLINRDSIQDKFIVLTTIQPMCPNLDSCGMSMYLFNEIFFSKMVKNPKSYKNVRVLSILTDTEGNAVEAGPSPKLIEEMEEYDKDLWWMAYGDPAPLFSFDYYGKNFMEHQASKEDGEVGSFAFINSLILVDKNGHIRGVSGAKRDSDLRNFFDMLKLLKKEDFDKKRADKK
jgi:protein SCO1/2